MTFNYCPPALYAFFVKVANENGLSIKEVQTMFMRKVAIDLGFSCDHNVVGISKTTGLPFCRLCWTRLIMIKPPTTFKGKITKQGEYTQMKTFLDKKENDLYGV